MIRNHSQDSPCPLQTGPRDPPRRPWRPCSDWPRPPWWWRSCRCWWHSRPCPPPSYKLWDRNVRAAINFINKYLHWRAKMQARYCFVTFGAASLKASKHFLLTVPSGVTISYSWVLNVSILNMALSKHWHFPSSSSSSMSLHSRENLDWEGIPTLCRNVYLTVNLCYYFTIQRIARIKYALIDL